MAQEVHIAGATFQDVPSISVPDSNNTYHSFTDVSDTTATASDVVSGKYFYTNAGVKTAGTLADGNNLEYGLTDGTLPIVGVGLVGSAEI